MPRRLVPRRDQLLVYLLLVLVVSVGFWRYDKLVTQQERDRATTLYEVCLSVRDNRQVIRDLVNQSQPISVPEGSSEALRVAIEDSNARAKTYRDAAIARLAKDEPDCEKPEGAKDG